ncbi:g-type lectin s-receptor-like serine/threonine-protein kinase [Quercus suber]|uniref:non-specific serine/threonine protein kinase n=1 Tax=Quercus suber TaxID=58331 RepID=A0AAW0LEB0_QUESU
MILNTHLLLLLLAITTIISQLSVSVSAATILPGSTLYASNPSQTWSSPNSTFFLGFLPINSTNSFIAAIFYAGGVPVWTAGTTPVDSSASLRFLSSGTLRLLNGSSHTVWDSNTASLAVSSASLLESGNLVLSNSTSTAWSSFDNPTDTIVPSQNFTSAMVLQSGIYSFRLLSTGNLTLRWNNTILYYNQGLNSSYNASAPILGLQSVGILSISDQILSTGAILAYSSDYAEGSGVLRFLRLDNDGNLRIYSSSKGSGTQTIRWAAMEDQCQVFGYCGDMGICSYNETDPVCGCPSLNFEPLDPNDSRKGCKRKEETKDCAGSATMLDLPHTQFLTYPPEISSEVFFIGISACRSNCLVSSTCDASTSLSDGTGLCYIKTPGFMSGYQSPGLPSSSYVKVCSPVVLNPSASVVGGKSSRGRIQAWVVALLVICTVFGLIALEGSLWWWCCRNSPKFGTLAAQYALLERLADQDVDMEQVVRAIQVSFWCIQEQPSHRPMMGKVVQMLEGIIEIEKPPVPTGVSDGSVIGTSINVSSNVSIYSTIAASVPAPSSSSSFQAAGVSPYASGRNMERASSSFLHSDPN